MDLHHLLLAGLPAHFESDHPSHAVFKPNGTSSHLARLAAVDRNYIAAHLVDKSH